MSSKTPIVLAVHPSAARPLELAGWLSDICRRPPRRRPRFAPRRGRTTSSRHRVPSTPVRRRPIGSTKHTHPVAPFAPLERDEFMLAGHRPSRLRDRNSGLAPSLSIARIPGEASVLDIQTHALRLSPPAHVPESGAPRGFDDGRADGRLSVRHKQTGDRRLVLTLRSLQSQSVTRPPAPQKKVGITYFVPQISRSAGLGYARRRLCPAADAALTTSEHRQVGGAWLVQSGDEGRPPSGSTIRRHYEAGPPSPDELFPLSVTVSIAAEPPSFRRDIRWRPRLARSALLSLCITLQLGLLLVAVPCALQLATPVFRTAVRLIPFERVS